MYLRKHPIPILPPKSEIILLRESPACATLCKIMTLTAQLFSRKFLYFTSCWSALGILICLTFADIIDEKNICFNACLNANEGEHFSPCVQQQAFTDPLTCQGEVRCQMYNIEDQGYSPIRSFNKIFLEHPLCPRHRRYPCLWAGRVRRGWEEQRKRTEAWASTSKVQRMRILVGHPARRWNKKALESQTWENPGREERERAGRKKGGSASLEHCPAVRTVLVSITQVLTHPGPWSSRALFGDVISPWDSILCTPSSPCCLAE